jgi:hypothetical protein
MEKRAADRLWRWAEGAACGILLAQTVGIEFFLYRGYERYGDGAAATLFMVFLCVMALGLIFYLYRFVWHPPAQEQLVIVSYVFLNLWVFILVSLCVGWTLVGIAEFVADERIAPGRLAFLTLWLCSTALAVLGSLRRIRWLQQSETYALVEKRIQKAGYRVATRDYPDRPDKPMRLVHVPWFMAILALCIFLGVGLLAMPVALFVQGNVNAFHLVLLVLGLIFVIFPSRGLKRLVRTMSGKEEVVKKEKKKVFVSAAERILKLSVFPIRNKVQSALFGYSIMLFLITLFSLAVLTISVVKESVFIFFISLLPVVGLRNHLSFSLDELRKEMRKAKSDLGLTRQQIPGVMEGVIFLGYVFLYLLLFGGLAILHEAGGASSLTFEVFGRKVPLMIWGMMFWAWSILSALASLHHVDAKPYCAQAARTPVMFRITAPIAAVISPVSVGNVLKWAVRLVDMLLDMLFRALKIPARDETPLLSLLNAKAIANQHIAQKYKSPAFLYALRSDDEGADLEKFQAAEWRFYYELQPKRTTFEVRVSPEKVRSKRHKRLPGGPPEVLPEAWLDPSAAVQAARAYLGSIFDDLGKMKITLVVYLPASRFPDMSPLKLPPDRPSWFIVALDEYGESIGDFFVDVETGEVLEEDSLAEE